MSRVASLPSNWENMLASCRSLSVNGTSVRFGEDDDKILSDMAKRYGISKAKVIRILVHAQLGGANGKS